MITVCICKYMHVFCLYIHVCAGISLSISCSDIFLSQDLAGTSVAKQTLLNRLHLPIPKTFFWHPGTGTARKRRRLKDAWLMVSAAAFGPALSLRAPSHWIWSRGGPICAGKLLEETWVWPWRILHGMMEVDCPSPNSSPCCQ